MGNDRELFISLLSDHLQETKKKRQKTADKYKGKDTYSYFCFIYSGIFLPMFLIGDLVFP